MSDQSAFRDALLDDYPEAVIRLATLRADGSHYLIFAWVELFPFDMTAPADWTAGERLWPVPGHPNWTCGFSARRVSTADALNWYEAAGRSEIHLDARKPIQLRVGRLAPEPVYGHFCTGVDAPFIFLWHDVPRVHRFVPLSAPLNPVRRLGASTPAHEWFERNLGFDPFGADEWLGGLALVAPNPLCSRVNVFPSARDPNGGETLTIDIVPRRSAARGIADLSSLSIHIGERRIDGWASFHSVALDRSGYATISCPQPCNQVAYALVCKKRGLLCLLEPQSWITQVNVGMNVVNQITRVEVQSGGRRKPGKTYDLAHHIEGPDVTVGEAVTDTGLQRLVALQVKRKAREKRASAPQKLLGLTRGKAGASPEEIAEKQKEAEDFIANLSSGAQRRLIFVDPYFGPREMRLFALRSSQNLAPRILTGLPALTTDDSAVPLVQQPGAIFVSDLQHIAEKSAVHVPEVRVMPGKDRPVIHDRYLIVDDEVWHCGPSFNELGERLGLVVRLQDPLSVRRIVSKVWCRSVKLSDFWREREVSQSGTP